MSLITNSIPRSLSPLQATLAKCIKANTNLNEASETSDIATYSQLLTNVIERTQNSTILPYISSYVVSKTPSGKIPSVAVKYAGKDESLANKIILTVDDTSAFTIGGNISSQAGAVGIVRYLEARYLLVEPTVGTFAVGDVVDNTAIYVATAATVQEVRTNATMAGMIFRNYSGDSLTTKQGEELANTSKNKFSVSMKIVDFNTTTKVIHTGFTTETVQDILSYYSDGYDKLLQAFSNIIIMEVEQDYMEWLRTISTVKSTVDLTTSLGMQSGIMDTYRDILGKVNMAIGELRANGGIDGEWFIIGSYKVIQALRTIDLITNTETKLINSKYGGKHITGNFTMIEDDNAIYGDDYCVVGHSGIKGFDNGSALFIPYSIDIVEVVNPETLQKEVGIKIRYTYNRNPLDSKSSVGDSDFVQSFSVTGFDSLPNF